MLHGLVAELIVPSVQTKDYEIRSQGLVCLGLCCLLDKVRPYSLSFLPRHRSCRLTRPDALLAVDGARLVPPPRTPERVDRRRDAGQGPPDAVRPARPARRQLRGRARHRRAFPSSSRSCRLPAQQRLTSASPCAQTDIILGFLGSSLDQEDPRAAATAVVGIAKLMLAGMITDEEVRRSSLSLSNPSSLGADADAQCPADPVAPRAPVLRRRDGRQPRAAAVPVVLLPRLLLLEPGQPAARRQRASLSPSSPLAPRPARARTDSPLVRSSRS